MNDANQLESIKQNLYEAMREVAPKDTGGEGAAAGLAVFNAKVAKYDKEKEDIKKGAEDLEHQRDAARAAATRASEHWGGLGNAIAIFQIAMALGSICLVTKKKWLWSLALVFSAAATAQMIHVWLK